MKVIGILQPGYLPWLGFFEQIHRSDIFVIYDDVKFDKNGWRNRNRIKTAQGAQLLTVPVYSGSGQNMTILDTKIDNKTDWKKKHLSSLNRNYSKAKYYKRYIGIFEEAYSKDWEKII